MIFMKLHEYEAKEIFKENNIPIPKNKLVCGKVESIDYPVVIKAQVLVGGRGKAGGILFADNVDDANEKIESLIGNTVKGELVEKVLLEEQIKIAQTAMVFVHLTTRFDKGLYGLDPDNPQGPKDRKAEEVDIVTKIICHKKAIDTSEREWFSSADDDMRY